MIRQNKQYYDEHSSIYEKERFNRYHLLVDDLETRFISKYVSRKRVLEAGSGTGLIQYRLKRFTDYIVGIDLSYNMLKISKKRNLQSIQADILALPFKKEMFNLIYSFKVIPHIKDINKLIHELDRVLVPKGYLSLEFYNKYSMRYLIKIIKRPTKVALEFTDKDVFTRYDTIKKIREYIPENYNIVKIRGIRIFTVYYKLYELPVLGNFLFFLEKKLCDSFLKYFGGFLVLILKKQN